MNDTNVRTLAAVPSGAIIMPTNFYGKSNFTAAFNNAESIQLIDSGSSGQAYQARYTINTDGTCTKFGGVPPLETSLGPTAWGSPTGGTPGNSYEARLNVTSYYSGDYVRFAGVNITSTGFTSWYALSSNRAIDVLSGLYDYSRIEGTLYIRNTSTLVEISRAFDLLADPTI
jgi:hypothetical protein